MSAPRRSGGRERRTPKPWAGQAPLRVAIVDRDEQFVRELAGHVRELGWILIPHLAAPTTHMLMHDGVDAIVLDILVLGFAWRGWLEHQTPRMPNVALLVCTPPSKLVERLQGLEAGADDWVTKPCSVEELAARVAAVVRARRPSISRRRPIYCAELEVRPDLLDVLVRGQAAGLTYHEFEVLFCLARSNGIPVRREDIYRDVWGDVGLDRARALDTTIRKIRGKLQKLSPGQRYIYTHRNFGYRLAGEE